MCMYNCCIYVGTQNYQQVLKRQRPGPELYLFIVYVFWPAGMEYGVERFDDLRLDFCFLDVQGADTI